MHAFISTNAHIHNIFVDMHAWIHIHTFKYASMHLNIHTCIYASYTKYKFKFQYPGVQFPVFHFSGFRVSRFTGFQFPGFQFSISCSMVSSFQDSNLRCDALCCHSRSINYSSHYFVLIWTFTERPKSIFQKRSSSGWNTGRQGVWPEHNQTTATGKR